MTAGVARSYRPWTITPGMPRSRTASSISWSSGEPAGVDEVVVLDPGEREGVRGLAEARDQLLVRLERDGGRLPAAPGDPGRTVHARVGVEQQLVVRRDRVPAKPAAAQRGQERLVPVGVELTGAAVVVEVQLAAAQGEDAAEHQLGHAARRGSPRRPGRARSPTTRRRPASVRSRAPRAAARCRPPGARWCSCSDRLRSWTRAASIGHSRAGRTRPRGSDRDRTAVADPG